MKIVIQIWNKIRDFSYEKIEKKLISRFSLQKIVISSRRALLRSYVEDLKEN